MHKASLLFIFEPNPGLESSMSTLRSGPRRPRSAGPRAPSRALFRWLQTCTHLHPVDLLQMKNKKVFMLFNTNTRVRSNIRPEPPPSGGVRHCARSAVPICTVTSPSGRLFEDKIPLYPT